MRFIRFYPPTAVPGAPESDAREAAWPVHLSTGQSASSSSFLIIFSLLPGTYTYTVSTTSLGYSAPAGSVTVHALALFVHVRFTGGGLIGLGVVAPALVAVGFRRRVGDEELLYPAGSG